ncbi:hypothetical protein HDU92_008726 [Lobulomyces angularis]|nr:hypothetical protein HDU92_008726 [Lobulomyces angularis]
MIYKKRFRQILPEREEVRTLANSPINDGNSSPASPYTNSGRDVLQNNKKYQQNFQNKKVSVPANVTSQKTLNLLKKPDLQNWLNDKNSLLNS